MVVNLLHDFCSRLNIILHALRVWVDELRGYAWPPVALVGAETMHALALILNHLLNLTTDLTIIDELKSNWEMTVMMWARAVFLMGCCDNSAMRCSAAAAENMGRSKDLRAWPNLLKRVGRAVGAAMITAALMTTMASESCRASEAVTLNAVLTELAPPPSDQALTQIPDSGRKLLALRSYLRYGPKITERWSWTEAEIKAFQGSPEQQALLAEIAAVNEHFKAANPGHELYVHGTVRSLDEQIAKWNTNESVGAVAEEILNAYMTAFGDRGLQPARADVERVATWLRGFQPSKRANLAAPGLTLHGRASAIDFQIMKDGRIYAGANEEHVESLWRAEGWDQKLKASMDAAGPSFSGPLTNPDEPWHYDYFPRSVDAITNK